MTLDEIEARLVRGEEDGGSSARSIMCDEGLEDIVADIDWLIAEVKRLRVLVDGILARELREEAGIQPRRGGME